MQFPLKGPGAPGAPSGGGNKGTVPQNAAQTPRTGAANTKAAGGTPPAKPFTGIWSPLVGKPGKG